jgi:hypothetical protein
VKDERVYLGHIRDAINDIEQYTSVGRDAFVAERMRQDAVIRKLEIMGEAVKQLSDATKDRRPEIPWKADRRHARSSHARLLWCGSRTGLASCRARSACVESGHRGLALTEAYRIAASMPVRSTSRSMTTSTSS